MSNKYSPLTSQRNTNATLDLLLLEVSLLPSHPVFLFRLSVVFVKVTQHKQGTHAGETNHFFPVPFSVCFRGLESLLALGRLDHGDLEIQSTPTMFLFKSPGPRLAASGPQQSSVLPSH